MTDPKIKKYNDPHDDKKELNKSNNIKIESNHLYMKDTLKKIDRYSKLKLQHLAIVKSYSTLIESLDTKEIMKNGINESILEIGT